MSRIMQKEIKSEMKEIFLAKDNIDLYLDKDNDEQK